MRHLNKIIFINSATIRYQEIVLDGNVHFVGTQGVGKSTVLRAILFFYNADTGKLGIAREKKSFAEFYFPYSNSYIVYEVARESGPFCVLAYKQSGRIAFRFIDGPYQADHFIVENRALEGWDKVRARLDEARIDNSRKVERYEEYRDILYGNNEGKKEFKKYALLESKLYQNIPRTIQNVFLNAKLEADFIKKTMIDSLVEDSMNIDLGIYRHHLQEFENEYKDIEAFKNKKTQERAEKIIELHNHIMKAEADKRENLVLLRRTVEREEKKRPVLEERMEKKRKEAGLHQEELNKAEADHKDALEKINREIGVWQHKITTAEQKLKEYRAKNIEQVVQRVQKEEELKNRQGKLAQEQKILTTAFNDIEQKYKVLLDGLDVEQKEFVNVQGNRSLEVNNEFARVKEELNRAFESISEQLRAQYKDKLETAEKAVYEARTGIGTIEKKQVEVKSSRFYEKELETITTSIREEEKGIAKSEAAIKLSDAEKAKLVQALEFETKNLERVHEQNREKLQAEVKKKEEQLAQINEWIKNSSTAMFGFLNEHYPGWENTIGKVCREDVIFNSGLSPQLVQVNNLLFGVKLDLAEMPANVKTLEEYNREQAALEGDMKKLLQAIEQLEEAKISETEKLKRKYVPKVREHMDAAQKLEYAVTQAKGKVQQLRIDLDEWQKKAAAEKKEALEKLEEELSGAKAALATTLDVRKGISSEMEEQLHARKAERDLKVKHQEEVRYKELVLISNSLQDFRLDIEKRKREVNDRKHAELQGKGLDTGRLKEVEKELGDVAAELSFIEQNRALVIRYQADKQEYFDKLDEFRANVLLRENERRTESEKFERQKSGILRTLNEVRQEVEKAEKELEEISRQLQAYEEFRKFKEFEHLAPEGESAEVVQTYTITDYISKIKDAHYSYVEKLNTLTSAVNDFTGRFTPNNIFSFRTGFIEPLEYIAFARILKEFIDENKLAEFERRVNKRYAEIINFIDKEITELTEREGDIQQVVVKINRDFQEKNFVGAISVIEMRIDDSENKIVDVLKRIRAFNAENHWNTFGGPNLFSSEADDKRVKEAINLLSALVKEIRESRVNYISLSDSFELKFRVVENQNDSGWVEKLSNIGSEGTDILVKAMINIMLLNVFKESASRKFKDFKLHCMMDEIGRLHPGNVRGILKFANDRNILLINGSPIEQDALAYRHIYELRKDAERNTRVKRLISVRNEASLIIS